MQAGGSGKSRTSQTSGGPRRQSGAPAPNVPQQDANRLGLPDLSGHTPPQTTPQVSPTVQPQQPAQPAETSAHPGQPHTLGVASAMARARSTETPSVPSSRTPTITQKMRAMAPPDIARQTMDEQKMLAHELITLPDALETSGLAKSNESSYLKAVRSYVDLANETWLAAAEEHLEQSGGEQGYRQRAIAVARQIMRMRNESQLAANNTQFPLPRKRPFLWRRRVQMHRAGLLDWQSHLHTPTDPRTMGASLARLRGVTALSQASDLELLLWSVFPATVGDVVLLLWLGFVIALIGVLAQGAPETVGVLTLAAATTLVARVLLSLLVRRGPARLDYLFAISAFSALRSPRTDAPGSLIVSGFLRVWGLAVMIGGLLGMVGAFAYSVWLLIQQPPAQPRQVLEWVPMVGRVITDATRLPALVGLAAVGVLALPLLLISAVRFARELGGNAGWVPAARRYALAPALHVLAFLAAGAMAALAALAPYTGLGGIVLIRVTAGSLTQAISLQTLALFATPVLILLVCLDIPFRVGTIRWRRQWLRELATRRTTIDAHVRRLAAADPQTGMQDTSDENLRAMQYDMVLLQFYNTRTDEIRRVSNVPYGWLTGIGTVLLLAVMALLVDGLAQQFVHLLLNVGA